MMVYPLMITIAAALLLFDCDAPAAIPDIGELKPSTQAAAMPGVPTALPRTGWRLSGKEENYLGRMVYLLRRGINTSG
jgi:hypothetical protein